MRNLFPFIALGLLCTSLVRAQTPPDGGPATDTWVATDGLGRMLPDSAEVGPPRPNRTVGMFYFLTFDHGQDGPYDNTQILKAHPEAMADVHNPAWGPLNTSHYWGEPLFGYYASDDEWVLRKHAQMLSAAGVDVVIFDNSNAVTYDKARDTLCRVWEQVRREGGRTPQIAFLCPFGDGDNMGGRTLRELYDTLYGPGLYPDLWFRWEGKPLVLAYPSYASAQAQELTAQHQPAELRNGGALGQTFTADRPFTAVGGEFPTWNTKTSGMTLALYTGGPGGRRLARRTFAAVSDNATVLLDAGRTLPAGRYYLEMSQPIGHVGWWSYAGDVYAGGQAIEGGVPGEGDRALHMLYVGETKTVTLSPNAPAMTPEAAARRAQTIRDFFTFRTPIAPYDVAHPPPGGWAWLQNYPQAPQVSPTGQAEQITVGVAQNYNAATHLAPMSFPGAFGRSYHAGQRDTRPDAVRYGLNFDEQWQRARQVDPPFVFITGWNEWTAGFYQDWAGYKAPPPIFVDEFSEEFSRDIEPMVGGHGDDYYYQLVANVRRYKGVRPVPQVTTAPIKLDGTFTVWRRVQPEFRNAVSAPVHRNALGVTNGLHYVNATGRNEIVAAKVSDDASTLYFYVRTRNKLTPHTDRDWMRLYLDTDGNAKTGWLGYDYAVNRRIGIGTTLLERNVGGRFQWAAVGQVKYQAIGNEMVVAIPRALLGADARPAFVDFKWADDCYAQGDWTDFLLNGDAAPIGRFNFRARF